MSSIKVVAINSVKEIKSYVRFKNNLYKGHKYAVPTLEMDENTMLNKTKNPASDFCEWQCYLAYNEQNEIVGRITAIINSNANKTWNKKEGRFGFFDFVEDIEVARALLNAAEQWIKTRGMTAIHGPLGFADIDEEGMLVEGYDELSTMASLYNYPYYIDFMNQLGYAKDSDWIEMSIKLPAEIPERVVKFASLVEKKNELRVLKFKNAKEIIKQGWAVKLFELINIQFADLYGFTPFTERQIDYYCKMYIPLLRLELVCIIVDKDNNLVGFGLAFPSMSRALQKSKGRMFPFGWFHMLRALKGKKAEIVDLMLMAVDEKYKNKGLTAIVMYHVMTGMAKLGAKYVETNVESEDNQTIHQQWDKFDNRVHKRRRAFIKQL